jgi:PAS domain S-box-containing protein
MDRLPINWANIVQHSREGIALLREGRIIWANERLCTIAGQECDSLLGQLFFDLVTDEYRDLFLKEQEQILAGHEPSRPWDIRLQRPQAHAWVEIRLFVPDTADPSLLAVTLINVTVRHAAIEKVKRLNNRLQSILHSMHDVVISLDVDDNSIISINPAAEILYGVPLRTLTNGTDEDILAFVYPEDEARVRTFYKELSNEEYGKIEYRIIHSDERVRWVRDEGYLVQCTAESGQRIDHVIRDITEQRKAAMELYRSEQRYRDFFYSTKDMAFCITPEGAFLDINDAGVVMLGFPDKQEALKSQVYPFFENPSIGDEILSELDTRGFVANKHVSLRTIANQSLEVDITARAKKDDRGNLLYYEGIATNITQSMENQRNRVLRHAAGGMCHHLNTHLMHIQNAQEGILEELQDVEQSLTQTNKEVYENLLSYTQDIGYATEKISKVTKAFNSTFLTYKEEPYLNQAIADIFHNCQDSETSEPQS